MDGCWCLGDRRQRPGVGEMERRQGLRRGRGCLREDSEGRRDCRIEPVRHGCWCLGDRRQRPGVGEMERRQGLRRGRGCLREDSEGRRDCRIEPVRHAEGRGVARLWNRCHNPYRTGSTQCRVPAEHSVGAMRRTRPRTTGPFDPNGVRSTITDSTRRNP